jgi:hypothetical protein
VPLGPVVRLRANGPTGQSVSRGPKPDKSRCAVCGAERFNTPEFGLIVPVQSAVAWMVTGVGRIPARRIVKVGNEIEPWGNEMFPAVSTLPSAVPAMPVIMIGTIPLIDNDPANATWTGPGFPTVAPAGPAVSTAALVKATQDPTATTVRKRVGLK